MKNTYLQYYTQFSIVCGRKKIEIIGLQWDKGKISAQNKLTYTVQIHVSSSMAQCIQNPEETYTCK